MEYNKRMEYNKLLMEFADKTGLSFETIARLINIKPRTVKAWIDGTREVSFRYFYKIDKLKNFLVGGYLMIPVDILPIKRVRNHTQNIDKLRKY